MSIIDQEIEELWTAFQLARREHQTAAARTLLKTALLYLHLRGLQSSIRLSGQESGKTIDLDKETEKTWDTLQIGEKYGAPGFVGELFKKSLQQMFYKGLGKSGASGDILHIPP